MERPLPRFHLAIAVDDLDAAAAFYGGLLGCPLGRRGASWVDFAFFGHQLSCHLGRPAPAAAGRVEALSVPIPHFGVILPRGEWEALAARITRAGHDFSIPPQRRFVGRPGEQGTFFLADPAGNVLEFKYFAADDGVFAADDDEEEAESG